MKLIQFIKNKIDEKKLARHLLEKKQRLARLKELKEELTQCRNNVRYIKACINVYRSNSKTIKGESAGDTRKKREAAKRTLEWYRKKLKEEESLVNYFEGLIS